MQIRDLDAAFPTVVRYTGVALTVVLVGASIAGYGLQLASGFVAAAGMILYKSVVNAGGKSNGDDR